MCLTLWAGMEYKFKPKAKQSLGPMRPLHTERELIIKISEVQQEENFSCTMKQLLEGGK